MELNNNLQILIDKAWALHVEISDRIDGNNVSFCRFCSENGHCFGVTETPLEKESLISIRDSLKNVKNMLVFLQVWLFSNLFNFFFLPSLSSTKMVFDILETNSL
ncbi:hypothetical protein U1Q18_023638 [Sarracenia purpurea var. burkii]